MNGFPFPELIPCRDVIVPRPGATEIPDLVMLPDRRAFHLKRQLSNSLFGSVHQGVQGWCSNPENPFTFLVPDSPERQQHVAVKRSSLVEMRRFPQENVFREISVMRYLSQGHGHPHVVTLVEACMSESHVYVVIPFYSGGDLLSAVVPNEGMGEPNAARWFRQVLLGLAYVHSKGLCHHDFSPENVMIDAKGNAAVVIDFGMVTPMEVVPPGDVVPARDQTPFGKMRYMAPEIFQNTEYDGRRIDIWSVGVTLMTCLHGDYVWAAPTRLPLTSRGIYSSDIFSYAVLEQHGAAVVLERLNLTSRVSAAAVEVLCDMLVVDRHARPTSAELLAEHRFFTAPFPAPL
eukprot:g8773.t1